MSIPMPHIMHRHHRVAGPVIKGPWQFEVVEKFLPRHPPAGCVRVKVHHVPVCGSDTELMATGNQFTGYAGPKPSEPTSWGHEFDGTVLELGEGVDETLRLYEGAHVVVEPYLPCLRDDCPSCARGWFNCCPKVGCLGFPPYDGAMMGLIDVPARNCRLVPPGLDGKTAALAELMGIIHHGHALAQGGYYPIDDSQWIVIVGFGRMGTADLLFLKRHTRNPVLVVARNLQQQERSLQMGANAVVSFNRREVGLVTGGNIGRIDETTGSPKRLTFAWKLVEFSPGGAKTLAFGCYNTQVKVNDERIQRIRRRAGPLVPVRRSNGEMGDAVADLAAASEHYQQMFGRRLDVRALHHIRDPHMGDREGHGPKDYFLLSERETA